MSRSQILHFTGLQSTDAIYEFQAVLNKFKKEIYKTDTTESNLRRHKADITQHTLSTLCRCSMQHNFTNKKNKTVHAKVSFNTSLNIISSRLHELLPLLSHYTIASEVKIWSFNVKIGLTLFWATRGGQV